MSTPTGPGRRAVLELVEVPRLPPGPGMGARARDEPWATGPRLQLEFVVDGVALSERLAATPARDPDTSWVEDPLNMPSVADLARPSSAAADLRRLAGVEPRDDDFWPLGPGRLPLYVCPECGDLGCGAITVHVDHTRPGQVTWSALRHEKGYEPADDLDLSAAGTFTFDADAYRQVLLEPVARLDDLAADERAAKARHRRQVPRRHTRRWFTRLLGGERSSRGHDARFL
ncbi:hypothetical protein [Pseudokineococcus lusitanus]|uniref:Uncharacterized protein n=1 Tax=Pseudokineococcus lusitanus TaxID=763993 RepID=A0A3N1HQ67_9ACTN|nr:hypothetical protein [Pseudokineococcus lusitanus]ROP44663.1 hypothetical protein EDC03_0789 [Pseudokineococcus lusitanus]